MAVNGRWALDTITGDDIASEATSWQFDAARARRAAVDTAERLRNAAADLDPDSPVAALVATRVDRFLA